MAPLQRRRRDGSYLLIYFIGQLLSAVLIGIMLDRLRIVPGWAAWAFALTSLLTTAYFAVHAIEIRYVLRYLICALWIIGAIPRRHRDVQLIADDLISHESRDGR